MSHLKSAVLPVVAILLVVLASIAPSHDDPARPPSAVDVSQTTYACPAGSVIDVTAGQVAAGSSRTARVLPGREPAPSLGDPGAWQTDVVDGPGVIVQQDGRRSGAVGYFAGTAPRAGGGGLVVGSCPGIVDDAWLLGLGSGDEHFSTLILTNLADSTASVDLTLWGPKGRIDAVDNQGVVIEPFAVRRIRVDSLAAGEPELAVHVRRTRGSVSVVANDTSTAASSGTEPVTTTRPPARDQVVGGIVKGASGRSLLVLNPGTATARVDVKVIGARSTFTPAGLQQVRIEPGALRVITVPESAGGDEQALRVTSDQPVAATVRMAPGAKDFAYAEAGAVLTGPTVVPVALGTEVDAPRVLLTAPDQGASVAVQTFDAGMRPLGSRTTRIPAGTTRGVTVTGRGVAYAVLTPTGRVVGAATYARGDGISSLALDPAPVTTLAPQVRPVG
ncbi:DUF5719 family protein [Aeromicrobium chenweiae]|uniref:Uncharacterized protein n=1 Tax=Aeromicrobium chenweiae TaxID=2079793 RepID=A0A2S0WP50_9ACTN|nr:DUF5719 family protein [Aeromicrobium chenweiae]AWB93024.1 hypothetical protein C3E78_12865 [Aeromicrobium chenweiae]TGN34014.1 hypothetical protein E4L97_02905 [Aeromicrobium chenweiae]